MTNPDRSPDNPLVHALIVAVAVVVVMVRFAAPLESSWDQNLQLEAAHRWYDGRGLTSTYGPV